MAQLTVEQRKDVARLSKRGISNVSLARKFHVSRSTIARWVEEGSNARPRWEGKPGRGRQKATTPQQRKAIKQQARRLCSINKIKANPRFNGLSRSTIRRVLQGGRRPLAWGVIARRRSLSIINVGKRLAFAEQAHGIKARTLAFVDSKYLYLYPDGARHFRYAWQDKEQKLEPGCHPNPTVLHFYSAVMHGHKGPLVFVPPTPTVKHAKQNFCSAHAIDAMKELYKEMKTWRGGRGPTHVVWDHARQHTSLQTQRAMAELDIEFLPGFPPQSWDMNIIENCWGMLDNNMQGRRPRSIAGYIKAVEDAWDKIDVRSINKLVASWDSRVAVVIQNKGKWPK